MGKALYRKYRSKDLSEIIGQNHVVTTLGNALKDGKVAHAYLLTGPRGTGKTSIARIIAHAVNGLTYSEDTHFDIIEIDAASNNGVEDVRNLREKVQIAPTSAKYKVYIIDEVHMLSKPAFNALLKTLEEPPEHVIFILATTDIHKVPETIISRTQRFSLQPVAKDIVVEHLRNIAKLESINATDEALELIAEHGEGSFRDSIGLLDQASNLGRNIEYSDIEALLGRAPTQMVTNLVAAIAQKDSTSILTILDQMYGAGFQGGSIASQIAKHLRQQLTSPDAKLSQYDALSLLRSLIDVPASDRPNQLLDIILLQQVTSKPIINEVKPIEKNLPSQVNNDNINSNKTVEVDEASKVSNVAVQATPEPAVATVPSPKIDTQNETPSPESVPFKDSVETPTPSQDETKDADDLWHEVLQDIKKSHNTLYGIARMAKPHFAEDHTLVLTMKHTFHQKRLTEARNANIFAKSVAAITGHETALRFLVAEGGEPQPGKKMDISNISNIFGGAELLE